MLIVKEVELPKILFISLFILGKQAFIKIEGMPFFETAFVKIS